MLTEGVDGIIFGLNQKTVDSNRGGQPKLQLSFGLFSALIVAEEFIRNIFATLTFCNLIGEKEMPVYEYECQECNKVFEVQQKIADKPLSNCPECQGSVKKLMSMTSFQLKGGGWYADGYSSTTNGATKAEPAKPAEAPKSCPAAGGCAACPAATSA